MNSAQTASEITSITNSGQPQVIKVLIVDDHKVVREGLRRMLDMETGIKVVGEASDGKEAITQSMALSPDVVTMDLKMPGMDGIAATSQLKKMNPDIAVVIFTLYADDLVRQAIEGGACGYILKTSETSEICGAIRDAHNGLCPITPSLTRDLVLEFAKLSRGGRSSTLTKRQIEILGFIADGVTSKEISERLYIRTSTVKREIRQILVRLHVADRAQAV